MGDSGVAERSVPQRNESFKPRLCCVTLGQLIDLSEPASPRLKYGKPVVSGSPSNTVLPCRYGVYHVAGACITAVFFASSSSRSLLVVTS